jgi:hypothetical protein
VAWADHRSEPSEIDDKSVDASIAIWRDYFWSHCNAALRQIGVSRIQSHARRALRWIRANQKPDVSLMDIRRDALGQRLDAAQTESVMESLARANWVKRHTTSTGGRPSQRWWIHPVLHRDAESAGSAGSSLMRPLSAVSAVSALNPDSLVALSRPPTIPLGSWPLEMRAETAAACCDEPSVDAFIAKVQRGIYSVPAREKGCFEMASREARQRHCATPWS